MEDDVADLGVELLPRGGEVEPVFLREAGEHLHVIGRRRVALRPGHHRALLEAERLVGDDQPRVEQLLLANPVAGRAGALRRVEGEQPRFDLLEREAADRAGEFLGEDDAVGGNPRALHRTAGGVPLALAPGHRAIGEIDIGEAIGELERGFEAVGKAGFEPFLHRQPVDHDLNVVLELLVERGCVLDRVKLAIDPHAGEARLLPFGQFLAVFALAPAHHRREQVEPRAFGQGHHAVDHVGDGLRLDRQAGGGRIGHADTRPQQAHVIVDLGHRRHGRTRIAAGGILLDRDRWREPVDMLDIGLLHHLEELPRISRQALDIAALSFGIDRVESEARLARARKAGDDDQAVARQVDVDALEIMLARAADGDLGKCHGGIVFPNCSLGSRAGKGRTHGLVRKCR